NGKDKVKDIDDEELKRFPVENVSWDDAQLFLKELNRQVTESGWVYRLPTEAQWEYACRGGPSFQDECTFDFYFDRPSNQPSEKQATSASNRAFPRKVGEYPPNRLGLHDMHGNVWEWCDDIFGGAAGGSARVIRGGSWNNNAEYCAAASRNHGAPSDRY